jgi:hypothetical protein
MSSEIELYRGADFVQFGRIPLYSVLREGMERVLHRDLAGVGFSMLLHAVPDDASAPLGSPAVVNLLPEFGYAILTLTFRGRVIYRHPHPVGEVIVPTLQAVLKEAFPEETMWGFCLIGPGLPRPRAMRPEPLVEGAAAIVPLTEDEVLPFKIRRLPDEPLPEAGFAEFGLTPPADDRAKATVKVFLAAALIDNLTKSREFSDQVEEGGFLIGKAFRDRDNAGAYLIEVTAALEAEHTGASLLHFTFTGDSFGAVKQLLSTTYPGQRLLGWWHTHLFSATDEMGLSSIDLNLHFTTFRQPWQLAGLVNIDETGRVLRFYVRHGDTMALCPHWVTGERG